MDRTEVIAGYRVDGIMNVWLTRAVVIFDLLGRNKPAHHDHPIPHFADTPQVTYVPHRVPAAPHGVRPGTHVCKRS